MSNTYNFLSGAAFFGAAVCGAFFYVSWRKTREWLLLIFALAFFTLAIERIVLLFLVHPLMEGHAAIYLLRLSAYLMILGGIWGKNRGVVT